MTNHHRRLNPNLKRIERALYRLKGLSPKSRRKVDIVFTDDRCMSKLAGKYRGSYKPTDVLAFGYGNDFAHELNIQDAPVGELVISLDSAKRQARERKMTLDLELLLLSVHGLLHLSELGDETYDDWCRMKRSEFELMMKIL